MAQEPTRRALRQTGMPPYEFPLGSAIARAAAAVPAPEPGVLERVGNFFQGAFPAINAARVSVRDGVDSAVARGDYARAAGNVVGGMVRYPAAAVVDTLAPVGAALTAIPSFVGGVLGSSGDTSVVKTAPAAAAPDARQAVQQALVQGRAATPAEVVTPQDALGEALQKILTSPNATLADISRAGALVPAVTKNGPKAKDTVLGQTAALSEAIFQDQVGKIDEAVKAGTITPEQAVIGKEKATAAWFARNGGLVGFDPSKLVQAQLLEGADEED